MLDGAMARPLHFFVYGDFDVAALAAAYAFGIARNHPFVDGNKCTAACGRNIPQLPRL
jgi:death-on-curing protein